MRHYTKEDIIRLVEEEDVEFIRLQFTDVFGNLKNMAVTVSQLTKVLNNQVVFDGSAVEGFAKTEESEMYLYPDLDTFVIFPWRPQQGKVARFLCDIYHADGQPYEGDSRYILKKVLAEAKELGYSIQAAPELEFFLLDLDENGIPSAKVKEQGGYFDVGPVDAGENARREMVMTLEEMGFVVEASHHEAAPAQHEIDLHGTEALTTADNIVTFKMAARTIARRHGLHATFMPKPNEEAAGSGMHIKLFLMKNGMNCFEAADGELGLSKDAYHFMAGILHYSRETAMFLNPLVNSYKRLSGCQAPVYVGWSQTSRSALLRVPTARGIRTGVELRNPDPAANPYLALALCIKAGLLGIQEKMEPGAELTGDLGRLPEEELKNRGIEKLPHNLGEALAAAKESAFVKEVLGEQFIRNYLKAKYFEWEKYSMQVSEWELKQYLNRF